jgi:hypothetical protein
MWFCKNRNAESILRTSSASFNIFVICQQWRAERPISVAAPSKAWIVFARSNAGIVGSNPPQSMDVCLRLYCVCAGSGLATGWSPIQGVLSVILGLRNWSETKLFTDVPYFKLGATVEKGREREREVYWNSITTELPKLYIHIYRKIY